MANPQVSTTLRQSRRRAVALLKLGLCFALTGCSGIDHATLDGVTAMPDDSSLTVHGGSMHTGIATGFKPRVWTHDFWGTHEQSSGIAVQTSNPNVVRVAPVTGDPRVVVWATAPGQSNMTVTLNGETALDVTITVTDPAN
jgi:hypothetical protein